MATIHLMITIPLMVMLTSPLPLVLLLLLLLLLFSLRTLNRSHRHSRGLAICQPGAQVHVERQPLGGTLAVTTVLLLLMLLSPVGLLGLLGLRGLLCGLGMLLVGGVERRRVEGGCRGGGRGRRDGGSSGARHRPCRRNILRGIAGGRLVLRLRLRRGRGRLVVSSRGGVLVLLALVLVPGRVVKGEIARGGLMIGDGDLRLGLLGRVRRV